MMRTSISSGAWPTQQTPRRTKMMTVCLRLGLFFAFRVRLEDEGTDVLLRRHVRDGTEKRE